MNNIYVGIDPSVNSTGVCISVYDDNDNLLEEKFYIVKPDKLTKKEDAAESKYISKFAYLLYDKEPTNTDNNSDNERNKAINFMQIVEKVRSIIFQTDYRYYRMNRIYICQEGISYGSSTRTKSIFDLSGLNFMFREMVINSSRGFKPVTLIVATPGEIKKFATGNGNANKELLLECFKATYPDFDIPKMDDIADAYFMAKYAKHYRNNHLD
jgi:Holliday junction resolvasome RuvABC endonuclease subunit